MCNAPRGTPAPLRRSATSHLTPVLTRDLSPDAALRGPRRSIWRSGRESWRCFDMQLRVTALPATTVAKSRTLLIWWHRRAAAPELIQWAWFACDSTVCTAIVVVCSSCHGSSARCPLIKWRLLDVDITMLRIHECFGRASSYALCMPSSHAAAMCSHGGMRLALCVSSQMLWRPRRFVRSGWVMT